MLLNLGERESIQKYQKKPTKNPSQEEDTARFDYYQHVINLYLRVIGQCPKAKYYILL